MTAWMQGLIDSSKIIRLSFSKSNSTYTKKDRETPSFRLLTKPNSSKRWALFYVKAEKKDKEIGGIPRVEALLVTPALSSQGYIPRYNNSRYTEHIPSLNH